MLCRLATGPMASSSEGKAPYLPCCRRAADAWLVRKVDCGVRQLRWPVVRGGVRDYMSGKAR